MLRPWHRQVVESPQKKRGRGSGWLQAKDKDSSKIPGLGRQTGDLLAKLIAHHVRRKDDMLQQSINALASNVLSMAMARIPMGPKVVPFWGSYLEFCK